MKWVLINHKHINMNNVDEFFWEDGDKIVCIRLYMGETLDPYLDREVSKVRAYDGGFDIGLAAA
jgi:hypothetical protein